MPDKKDKSKKDQPEIEEYLSISKDTTLKELATQVQQEYKDAYDNQNPKKKDHEVRFKLFNNQRRDKEAVGDTTMFTSFQTVLASLYSDKLTVRWTGREEGDDEQSDNLNAVAEYDYDQMEKDQMDYDWVWNTLFFGRALIELSEWRRDPENKIFLPIPRVLDPIPFIRDEFASSVNGDVHGDGAARFLGGEMKMSGLELESHPHRTTGSDGFDLKDISYGSDTFTQSLQEAAKEARDTAQNRQYDRFKKESRMGSNSLYDITRWWTHMVKGGEVIKVKVWLANERSQVVALEELGKADKTKWKLIDRALYPHSNDWDGTSIPDLTEDKQRGRAVAQNLAMNLMKADLYPMYLYDTNKVENTNDLGFGYNKFIPVNARGENIENAVRPLRKGTPNLGLLDFIYTSLDTSAQIATATPEIQRGALSSEQRTLGELNLVSSKIDTRFSLSAKIFGWSEKRFWRTWYTLYKENFKEDIDEKIIRIAGAFGEKHRTFEKSNLVTDKDPDLKIESEVLSRAKQLEERQAGIQYFSLVLQDPTSNKRYILRKMGKLSGFGKDEIDRLLPPTVDERIAEQQNILLNEDKLVPVVPEDDHNVHLEVHSRANYTPAAQVHIQTHIKALSIKKTNPEMFPPDQEQMAQGQPGQAGQPGQGQTESPFSSLLSSGNLPKNEPVRPSDTSSQI